MPSKAKKCAARSHDEAHGCLCSVCFEKTSPKTNKVISSDIESQIQTFGNNKFSLDNTGLPNIITDSCRMKLDHLSKNPDMENTLPMSDYEKLIPPPPEIRNQSRLPCPCTVCELARTKLPCRPVPEQGFAVQVCIQKVQEYICGSRGQEAVHELLQLYW